MQDSVIVRHEAEENALYRQRIPGIPVFAYLHNWDEALAVPRPSDSAPQSLLDLPDKVSRSRTERAGIFCIFFKEDDFLLFHS